MILTAFLGILCISLASALTWSMRTNIAFMERVDEIEASLQKTLDILDEQHQKIDQKSKLEVFSDDPVVRDLVRDIAIARNSILLSAKILDDTLVDIPVEETETQDNGGEKQ